MTSLQKAKEQHKRQNAFPKRSNSIYEQLTQLVLDGKSPEAITQTLAQLVNNPVIVENARSEAIAMAIPEEDANREEAMSFSGEDFPLGEEQLAGIPRLLLGTPAFAEFAQTLLNRQPLWLSPLPQYNVNNPRLIIPIVVEKQTLGYISVIGFKRELCPIDLATAGHGATVLALHFMKEKAAFEAEQRVKGDFLERLLSDKELDEILLKRASYLNYDPNKPSKVIVAHVARRTIGERAGEVSDSCEFDTVTMLSGIIPPGSITVSKGKNLVILLTFEDEDSAKKKALSLAGEIKDKIEGMWPQLEVSIGVGQLCRQLGDYHLSYLQAQKCITAIKALGKSGQVISFEDLGIFGLLYNPNIGPELLNFVRMTIGPLEDYDRRRRANLIDTLTVYLMNGAVLSQAAKELYIHVNTMRQRLERIQQLCKVDLSQAETRFNLHLALKLKQGLDLVAD